jgi:hypothetical protein
LTFDVEVLVIFKRLGDIFLLLDLIFYAGNIGQVFWDNVNANVCLNKRTVKVSEASMHNRIAFLKLKSIFYFLRLRGFFYVECRCIKRSFVNNHLVLRTLLCFALISLKCNVSNGIDIFHLLYQWWRKIIDRLPPFLSGYLNGGDAFFLSLSFVTHSFFAARQILTQLVLQK